MPVERLHHLLRDEFSEHFEFSLGEGVVVAEFVEHCSFRCFCWHLLYLQRLVAFRLDVVDIEVQFRDYPRHCLLEALKVALFDYPVEAVLGQPVVSEVCCHPMLLSPLPYLLKMGRACALIRTYFETLVVFTFVDYPFCVVP